MKTKNTVEGNEHRQVEVDRYCTHGGNPNENLGSLHPEALPSPNYCPLSGGVGLNEGSVEVYEKWVQKF